MKQVRHGVFETNSSSTHSLVICTTEEYKKFENGELLLDEWGGGKMIDPSKVENPSGYQTHEEYFSGYLEPFYQEFTTPSGDKMVAFGQYGYDG